MSAPRLVRLFPVIVFLFAMVGCGSAPTSPSNTPAVITQALTVSTGVTGAKAMITSVQPAIPKDADVSGDAVFTVSPGSYSGEVRATGFKTAKFGPISIDQKPETVKVVLEPISIATIDGCSLTEDGPIIQPGATIAYPTDLWCRGGLKLVGYSPDQVYPGGGYVGDVAGQQSVSSTGLLSRTYTYKVSSSNWQTHYADWQPGNCAGSTNGRVCSGQMVVPVTTSLMAISFYSVATEATVIDSTGVSISPAIKFVRKTN